MNSKANIRIVIYFIINLFMIYLAIGYIYEIYNLDLKQYLININDIENINIDGANFTPEFKLMGNGMNNMLNLLIEGSYAVIIFFFSLFLALIYYFVLIKNKTIEQQEYNITKKIYITMMCISIIIGAILSRFHYVLLIVLYNLIWGLILYLGCISPKK